MDYFGKGSEPSVRIVVMDFTRVYEMEKFYRHQSFGWIDCTGITGTDGYCDEKAKQTLRERIKDFPVQSIHFIDSGNHHYMTELWLEKADKDLALVVFDHHSDMQRPLFGDLLSCGSWILNSLETNAHIKYVLLIGLSEEQKAAIPHKYRDRVRAITQEDLKNAATWKEISKIDMPLPLYISVDKDVLSETVVDTTWDQGNMTMEQLKKLLHLLIHTEDILGIDICGECPAALSYMSGLKENDDVNRSLLLFLEQEKEKKE